MIWLDQIHVGDCRALMRAMIAAGVRVNCIVTSPPYWGLRDYGVGGQFGLERTWLRHVARMRGVFRLARDLLADDGSLWLNYGDSYNTTRAGGAVGYNSTINGQRTQEEFRKASRAMKSRISPPDVDGPNRRAQRGLKAKDLVGMPWRIAFALQADGWYLRSDIVWHKPNPMPESITDRPTKSHEYVFLLSREARYFYDAEAIAERATNRAPGNTRATSFATTDPTKGRTAANLHKIQATAKRNSRSVWSITTSVFGPAHFATFPRELVRRCILAGSRPGDTVFDPFMGSGTVAEVALSLGRHFIGTELNPEYAAMFKQHRSQQVGLGV